LYGGNSADPGSPTELDGLWVWNGTTWAQLSPTGNNPSTRYGAMMCKAPGLSNTLMLWGGLGDTNQKVYLYDRVANTWTDLAAPATAPPVRRDGVLFYDEDRDVAVLYGGAPGDDFGTLVDDVWEWDGALWREKFSQVAKPLASARALASALNTTRKEVLLAPNVEDHKTWVYDLVGRLWSYTEANPEIENRRGMAVAFDPVGGDAIAFGGESSTTGVPVADMSRWSWSEEGIAPYVQGPGVLHGRLQPQLYETDSGYVYVFGLELEQLPEYLVDVGDELSIVQTFGWPGDTKLIRFDAKIRYDRRMPKYRKLEPGAGVVFTDDDLAAVGDGLEGVRLPEALFAEDDRDRLLAVSGATVSGGSNNALPATPHRVTEIISGQGQIGSWAGDTGTYPAGTTALVEHASANFVDEVAAAPVTLELLGAQWRLSLDADIDGGGYQTLCSVVEQAVNLDPDGFKRTSLAAHLSKVADGATVILRFRLTLEATTS
jgi:hypothetical protein